jgi:uncharacterized membrane protein
VPIPKTLCCSRIRIEDSITIARPVAEVFAFYKDLRNLPRFLGDVVRVDPTGVRSSRWTVQGPFGMKVHWISVVTEIKEGAHIFYETSSRISKTKWEIYFSQGKSPEETVVREVLIYPGGRIGKFILATMGKHPAAELHSNLQRFRQLIESGRVTDTSNSIPGKFDHGQ